MDTRAALVACAVLGALCALPLWLAPWPVMQDLPAHAETGCQLAQIWRDNPTFTGALFVHPQPWANSAVTVVLGVLAWLGVPGLIGAKLVLTLALVAWPVAVAWMLATFRRSPWLALLALPLSFDLAWSYGFVPFICAKPLVPVCAALARRALDAAGAARARRAVALALVLLAVFIVHSLVWMIASAVACLVVLVCAQERRDAIVAVAVPIAALGTLPFFAASRDAAAPGATIAVRDPLAALAGAWGDLGDLRPGGLEAVPFVAALVAIGVLLWRTPRALRAPATDDARGRLALLACALLIGAAWLLGPVVLPQVSVVSPRLLSLAVMFLLVALPPVQLLPRAPALLALLMSIGMAVHGVDTTRAWRAFSTTEMGDFDALLARIPQGARVATHYTGTGSPFGRHNALWHWGKLGCDARGAITDDLFAYRKTHYIEVRPEVAARFITPPHRLRREALLGFDALLLRGDARVTRQHQDVLVPLGDSGSWHLFAVRRP